MYDLFEAWCEAGKSVRVKAKVCTNDQPNAPLFHLLGPSGRPDLPDLLCGLALEVHAYDGAPTASKFRQTRQTVDPGITCHFEGDDLACLKEGASRVAACC